MTNPLSVSDPVAGNAIGARPGNNAYFPALDGIRALAFVMVFGSHYLGLPWGFTGVDAFFVLSGFLITGILFDTCNASHRVWNFYVRRTLRIFPLYYGVIAIFLLVDPIFHWRLNWTWLVWPTYLGNFATYVHPASPGSAFALMAYARPVSSVYPKIQLFFGHFWSLCVEEQFYLFWPWIVFWIKDRRKLMVVCASSLVICLGLRLFAHLFLPRFMVDGEIPFPATPFRVDSLLLGGLVALARRGSHWSKLATLARFVFPVMLAMILVWHIFERRVWVSLREYHYPSWQTTWGLSFADVFFACLIVIAIERGSLAFRVFNLRPLRWLGRMTYGAYVFHEIFHKEFIRLGLYFPAHAILATAVIAFVFTCVISWASFRWYESRFIALKDRWTKLPVKPQNSLNYTFATK